MQIDRVQDPCLSPVLRTKQYKHALSCYGAGNFDEAKIIIENMLALHPDDCNLLLLLERLCYRQGNSGYSEHINRWIESDSEYHKLALCLHYQFIDEFELMSNIKANIPDLYHEHLWFLKLQIIEYLEDEKYTNVLSLFERHTGSDKHQTLSIYSAVASAMLDQCETYITELESKFAHGLDIDLDVIFSLDYFKNFKNYNCIMAASDASLPYSQPYAFYSHAVNLVAEEKYKDALAMLDKCSPDYVPSYELADAVYILESHCHTCLKRIDSAVLAVSKVSIVRIHNIKILYHMCCVAKVAMNFQLMIEVCTHADTVSRSLWSRLNRSYALIGLGKIKQGLRAFLLGK